MKRARPWALVLALLSVPVGLTLLGAGGDQPVQREAVVSGYRKDADDTTAYRSALDGGEGFSAIGSSTATSGPVATSVGAVTTISCGGYPNVSVSMVAATSGATCVLTAVRFAWDGTTLVALDTTTWTMTANATYTKDGEYFSTSSRTVDTQGCKIMKILAADPSAGAVDLYVKVH